MLHKEHQQRLYPSERHKSTRTKNIILAARLFSMLFAPFYLPLVGLIALFLFSYLSLLPLFYKIFVLSLVCVFTILIPTLLIRLYRHYQGWTLIELGHKERRMVPYVLSNVCIYHGKVAHTPFHGKHHYSGTDDTDCLCHN